MKIETILATKGPKVVTVHPDESLRQVIALLREHSIGALVVVDGAGAPVGIISERDIVRRAVDHTNVFDLPVERVMTRDVITGTPQDDLRSVLRTMTEKHFRHLPIVDRGNLVGIISIGDVVKAQLDEYRGELETMETRIT